MSSRVLFVDVSPCSGGAQRSLFGLVAELQKRGLSPSVLTADDSTAGLGAWCGAVKVETGIIPTRNWPRSWRGLIAAWTDLRSTRPILTDFIEKNTIDLVYANGLRSGLLCTLALPKDIPIALHHRDVRAPEKVFRRVAGRADYVITISDFQNQRCIDMLGEELAAKLTMIYNGFDWGAIRADSAAFDARAEFNIPADVPLAILVADMVAWKRHGLFLEAIKEVRTQRQDVQAIVVGGARDESGEAYERDLRRFAEANDLDNITFTGHVPNPYPIIKAADVLVSVAEEEPFGRTIVEAWGLGTRVVVAGGGGAEELVGDQAAGEVVDGTAAGVASGIIAAIANAGSVAAPPDGIFSAQRHADQVADLLALDAT